MRAGCARNARADGCAQTLRPDLRRSHDAPTRTRAAPLPAVAREVPDPDDGESRSDFLDRCVAQVQDEDGLNEDDAEDVCQIAWEDSRGAPAAIVKDTVAPVHEMQFVLSDETPDRYGDIVSAGGWDLNNFRKNPIALFGHNHDFPVGRWQDLHVENSALRGTLALAPQGTSARIDEIRALIDAGILKAVSVGFRTLASPEPIKSKDGTATGGLRFVKHELLECSVVPVPANPNALAIAKALKVSSDTLRLVFAEPGNQRQLARRGDFTGELRRNPSCQGLRPCLPPSLIVLKARNGGSSNLKTAATNSSAILTTPIQTIPT